MALNYPINLGDTGGANQLLKKAGVNVGALSSLAEVITGGILTFAATLGADITLNLPTASGTLATTTAQVKQVFLASTTADASLNIPHGVAPTVPVNGDLWTTTAGLFVQINGSTVALGAGGGGTIGGSIAANQVAVGSGTDAIAGSANFTWDGSALALTGTSTFTGNMAIGTTTSTTINLKTRTATTADVHCFGADIFTSIGGSVVTAREITALTVTSNNVKTAGNGDWVCGAAVNVTCSGVGGRSNYAEGVRAYVTTSHLTDAAYGIRIRMNHTGTVTNSYICYLTSIGAGTVTNRYGIYQVEATVKNYFGGFVSVGATTTTTTYLGLGAGTTAVSSLRIPHGAAPTAPVNGDLWTTTAGLFVQINGSTVALGAGGGGTPAGSDTELQFNNAGAFGASANLSYSSTYAKTVIANQYGAMYIAGQPNPSVGTYHLSSVYVDTDVATSAASGFANGVFSYVKHAATTVNPTLRGVRALVSATGSAAGAGSSVYGVFSEAFNSRSAGTSNVYGGSFTASCNASGGGGDAYGISASANKTTGNNTGGAIGGSFTVTSQATTSSDVFALYARVNVISGTLTTVYGLYIDVGTGTVTNRYGIYQVGPTAKNVFEGFTGLGGSVASTTTILNLPPGTTAVSSLRISHGVAPTSPVNGDMWTTTAGLYIHINGVTVGPLS